MHQTKDPSAASRAPRDHRALGWLALLALASTEVLAHWVAQARVVPETDWDAAAAWVQSEWRDGDTADAAPRWADPLMRRALGETLGVEAAARADLRAFSRLWVFSTRGHRSTEAAELTPEETRAFGRVLVARYALPAVPVAYDLTAHIGDARVTLVTDGVEQPCRAVRGRAAGGGLGSGPLVPAERHVCDPARSWLWVGATVEEDLDMLPRRCVWQHPAGAEPVRASWDDVPLGDRVRLFAGLWWEHERTGDGGVVDVIVRVEGDEIARLSHEDGAGWMEVEAPVPEPLRGARGRVAIEVVAGNPHVRSLCWAARTEEDR